MSRVRRALPGLIALLLAVLLTVRLARQPAPTPGTPALIDRSHHPFDPTPASLTDALTRHGTPGAPLEAWRPGALRRARILLLPPSLDPLTPPELRALTAFLEGGGLAVVAARPGRGATGWLTRYGIRLTRRPLGGGAGAPAGSQIPVAEFAEAWGLELSEHATPLIHLRGTVVAASASVGRGQLIVVGDPHFLAFAGPRNRAFASWLLRRAR